MREDKYINFLTQSQKSAMLVPSPGPFRGQHIQFSDCLHRRNIFFILNCLNIFSSSLKLTPQCSYRMSFLLSLDSPSVSVILVEGSGNIRKILFFFFFFSEWGVQVAVRLPRDPQEGFIE